MGFQKGAKNPSSLIRKEMIAKGLTPPDASGKPTDHQAKWRRRWTKAPKRKKPRASMAKGPNDQAIPDANASASDAGSGVPGFELPEEGSARDL